MYIHKHLVRHPSQSMILLGLHSWQFVTLECLFVLHVDGQGLQSLMLGKLKLLRSFVLNQGIPVLATTSNNGLVEILPPNTVDTLHTT